MRSSQILQVFVWILLLGGVSGTAFAQDKNLVQIKAFDQQMNPVENVSLSVNGKEFIPIRSKKATFYEIAKEDLPPKFVNVDKKDLEAESWSYSKGTLEVILRKRSYFLLDVYVEGKDKKPVGNIVVTFKGKKPVHGTTNPSGIAQLPLGLDDKATLADQFNIPGYRITKMAATEKGRIITVEAMPSRKEIAAEEAKQSLLQEFDINQLDSIRSLTVFYAFFKNFDIASQEESVKQRFDAKFKELVSQSEQSKAQQPKRFTGKISDSSFVRNDVKNLLDQAKYENELLDDFRNEFDRKINIISQKISAGTSNLDAIQREKLIEDLDLLETVLRQNEDKFYKNISDYRIILSSLKSSFSDIKKLETKLSIVEAKRLEEQRDSRNKIFFVASVALVFGVLLIFLVLLRGRLKKQQVNLILANDQIRRMNENLEVVVFERTRLLIDAHHEMDIFLYRSSHDLRAPICTIMGLCNIALHNEGPSHDLIHKIADTAFKMDGMLRKLRMISEINQPSNYSPILLADKINAVVSYFTKFINDHVIDVEIDCDQQVDFSSYPDLLEIILYNLIDNALFFSTVNKARKPLVIIKASLIQDHLQLSIYDNGIGIDEKMKVKLWDMFYVGHEYSKGNGLGLYIVFKSIQALKGTIEVETERNIYTKFIIKIPVNTSETSSLNKRIKDQYRLVSANE